MRYDDAVTSVTARHVHPVVYIDVDIDTARSLSSSELADASIATSPDVCNTVAYPGLRCKLLTERGPGGGNPVYRIEGPLSQLIDWLVSEYASGGELDTYTPLIGLAR